MDVDTVISGKEEGETRQDAEALTGACSEAIEGERGKREGE